MNGTSPAIVPVVEGAGEKESVPLLLRRLLWAREQYGLNVRRPKNAHGRGNLTCEGGIEQFVRYAAREPGVAGILVLVDADNDCPLAVAATLAERSAACGLGVPVAVVAARRCYESWLVASAETIADLQAAGLPPAPRPEDVPNPKGWLGSRLPPPRGYKEASDQVSFTGQIDLDRARHGSRSFRALDEALAFLLANAGHGTGLVFPDHYALQARLDAQN